MPVRRSADTLQIAASAYDYVREGLSRHYVLFRQDEGLE